MRKRFGLITGPLVFVLVLLVHPPLSAEAVVVLATTLWMAIWWITEAVPIPATALLPLAVFPAAGVIPAGEVSSNYFDPNIVLFLGGFFLAMSIQKWKLHRRIALFILSFLGGNMRRLVLGFMVATAFLSMWVSNTATTIMMLPIATAVVMHLKEGGLPAGSRFPTVLMLAVAYSASIGGVATLIGTPPNIVLASQFSQMFPEREPITFARWMAIGLPFAGLFLPAAWFYLTRIYGGLGKEKMEAAGQLVAKERARLGPMKGAEKRVALVFLFTALAWIFRADLVLGPMTLPGWSSLLGVSEYVHDSTVAVVAALLLFSLPSGQGRGEFLLDWSWAVRIPWGILILFGGGLALANAFQSTGLARWVGETLLALRDVPPVLLVVCVCLMLTFLTEITSNTATAALFMPILGGMAVAFSMPPELLMIPAAISASCAFMLPVATPPNAIIFASEYLSIPDMVRAGVWLNLLGVAITTLVVSLLVGW